MRKDFFPPTPYMHSMIGLISQRRWMAYFKAHGRKTWVLRISLGNRGFIFPQTFYLPL
jgi:hypothetical protein